MRRYGTAFVQSAQRVGGSRREWERVGRSGREWEGVGGTGRDCEEVGGSGRHWEGSASEKKAFAKDPTA